jgi:hypothetical protein
MCLESIGKDKAEPEEHKEGTKCIKIEMIDAKRSDFCWTNNPIFPQTGISDRLLEILPKKEEAINAIIGCGVGAAFAIWTGPGALVACAVGAGTSLAVDEVDNILQSAGDEDGLKGEAFIRAGGLPVTESTSYITDTSQKLHAVEIGPTAIIGGSALKRLGEISKNLFDIQWAWPR